MPDNVKDAAGEFAKVATSLNATVEEVIGVLVIECHLSASQLRNAAKVFPRFVVTTTRAKRGA